MAIEAGNKVIPPHSKFTSELDMNIDEDRTEMEARVFGRNYRTDRRGNPIDEGRGSDAWYVSDARLPRDQAKAQERLQNLNDTFRSHINAIKQYGPRGFCAPSNHFTFSEDADKEAARINELRKAEGLRPLPFK